MSDIFISYAHEDRETARGLARILDSLGWGVWWDRTILAGETFDQVIEEALDGAACVIVIWSEHSVASRWVRTEAEEAARRRVLVPVVIDQVKIPLAFRRIQAENMSGWDGSSDFRAFVKLKAAIEQVLGRAPAEVEAHRQAAERDREQEQQRALEAEARRAEQQAEEQAKQERLREQRAEAPVSRAARSHETSHPQQQTRVAATKPSRGGVRWLMALGAMLLVGSLSWFAWDMYSQVKFRDAQLSAAQQKRDQERQKSEARMAELEDQVETVEKEKEAEAKLRQEQERKAAAAQAEKDKMAQEARRLKQQAAARTAQEEAPREADSQPDAQEGQVARATEAGQAEEKTPAVNPVGPDQQDAREAAPPPKETPAPGKPTPIPEPGMRFRDQLADGSPGPEMVVIPRGVFTMGDDDGGSKVKPVRAVRLSRPLALGRHEVTFSEFDVFARATGRPLPKDRDWGRGERPVIYVSWDDATAYADWLSEQTGAAYRLPSEAEWEYAARAGSTSNYWWGNRVGRKRANCNDCKSEWDGKQTAPVGSFAANDFGLTDTAGNVWEWVQDCWNKNYAGAPTDGTSWLSGNCNRRVIRGGSWADGHTLSHSTTRLERNPQLADYVAGFRVCREL